MPSRLVYGYHDFVFRFRRSPAAIAATAGAIGVICGALVIGILHKPWADAVGVAQNQPVETVGTVAPEKADLAQMQVQTPPAATAETTTMAAPAGQATPPPTDNEGDESTEASASAYCERQTWPYITQDCLTETTGGQRKVRVITTDNIAAPVVSAIEASRVNEPSGAGAKPAQNAKAEKQPVAVRSAPAAIAATPAASKPAAQTPAAPAPKVATAPAAPAPAAEAKAIPARAPQQPSADQAAAPANAAPAAAPAAEPEPQRTSTKEARSKNARDKRKREAKSRRAPPPSDGDDDEVSDSIPARAAERRGARSNRARIVERWTEREYDVPSYNGSGERRRVIVIRRSDDRTSVYMPSPGGYARSIFQY
jgi:hypothetical protein